MRFGSIARRVKPPLPSDRTSQTFAGVAMPRSIFSLARINSLILREFII